MSTALVIDSTTFLPKEVMDSYIIRSAPAIIIWEGNELLDGIDIQPSEFFERLAKSEEHPTTSQATPQMFKDIYQELLDMGHDIFAITISSKLSGFNASANQAKADFPDANIEVLDSLTGAGSVALVLDRVIAAAKGGASPQDLKAMAKAHCENTNLLIMPETLEYLYRGGRIGGAARFLGTALKTLPILEIQEGAFEGVERVRTHAKALDRLVEISAERVGGRKPVHVKVIHANAHEMAEKVLEKFKAAVDVASSGITDVSPGVGVHLGPGTVGISFLAGVE